MRNVSLFSGLAPAEIDGILGPGRLCGHMGLIDGVAHSTTMVARENTTLLEIAKPAFDRRYHGCERINLEKAIHRKGRQGREGKQRTTLVIKITNLVITSIFDLMLISLASFASFAVQSLDLGSTRSSATPSTATCWKRSRTPTTT
ncbi:MAG: hypothetical protein A2W68_10890 [Betaproteobacteria bacterium RIFCSPLOWO2_02_64_14]|nr:MAG: hypothetical protein A2W68_10890 [Betaproteobacteria bacterium RIFCSPLOWO2_02_64_14]